MFDPPDLPYLTRQLNALRTAMTSGGRVVDYPERGRVEYRSFVEMRQQESYLLSQIAASEGVAPVPVTRRVVVTSRSGF